MSADFFVSRPGSLILVIRMARPDFLVDLNDRPAELHRTVWQREKRREDLRRTGS